MAKARDLLLPYVPALLGGWSPHGQVHRIVDGSLLFVDVSGFTALSERLARRGAIGTELLTEVLDTLFSSLLVEATGRGGDLLKFGGDAVLLLFSGARHADRSAAAALAMQRRLRRAVSVPGIGALRLRASMGIHSGEIHAVAAGVAYPELVMIGPAVDEVLATEAAANAGEVLASKAAADAMVRVTFGERRPHGTLVVDAAGVAAGAAPELEPSEDGPQTLLTPPLRRTLLSGDTLVPAHRSAAIGFVKFSGTTTLLERDGPGPAAAAVGELIDLAHRAAARHDITLVTADVNPDGGKLVLVGGAPTSTGDDVDRVLLCALEIVEGARQLPCSGGVNAGRVFVGPLGPPRTRAYAVIGDVVNTAARIAAPAPYGSVLVTETAWTMAGAAFSYDPVAPVVAKGKKAPVLAGRVGRPTGPRLVVGATSLVGRGRELDELAADAAAVRSERDSRTVLIEADAGLGKSHVLAEFANRLDGFEVLGVTGGRFAAHDPYRAVRAGLAAVLRGPADLTEADLRAGIAARAPDLEPFTDLLSIVFHLDVPLSPQSAAISPARRAARVHELWRQVLLAPGRPVAVLVEDAHWLDAATCDLLTVLTTGEGHADSEAHGVLAVATRRPGDRGWRPDAARILALGPLCEAEARTFVRQLTTTAPLHPAREAEILRLGAGNAFFLRQLVDAGDAAAELPATVDSVVSSNLDRLDRESRAIVQTASVLGATTSVDLLAELLDREVAALEQRLVGLGNYLCVDGGVVSFTHALVQEAAYGQLPFQTRRKLHDRAAASLEERGDQPFELLAIHHYEAGNDLAAWEYNLAAAKDARVRWAQADAAAHLRRAVAVANRSRRIPRGAVAALHYELAELDVQLGYYDEAETSLLRARRATPPSDAAMRASIEAERAVVRERRGRLRDAIRRYERALALAEGFPDVVAQLEVGKAGVLYRLGELAAARSLLTGAVVRCERLGLQRPLAQGLKILATVESELGESGATSWFDRALTIYEQLGDIEGQAGVVNNRASDHLGRGSWREASRDYEQARRLYELAGSTVDAAMPAMNLGELLLEQGRLDDARELIAWALQRWQAIGYPVGILFARSLLGVIELRASAPPADATDHLTEAHDELLRLGLQGVALIPAVGLVEADLAAGRLRAAVERSQALEQTCEELGQPQFSSRVLRLRGIALCRLGERTGGRRALTASLGTADLAASIPERAFSLRALALLADPRHASEAERLLGDLGVVVCYVDRYCA